MKFIKKKILPNYYEKVKTGVMQFVIRKDEDGVSPGDLLLLCEYENNDYTGRIILKKVSYVLRNVPQYGLMDGYCIIGF